MRIVVLGYIIRGPLAGFFWHHVQYVLGLKRLGHDVAFIEDSEDYPCCYDPQRNLTDDDPTYGLAFAQRVFTRLELQDQWAYFDAHRHRWSGPLADQAEAFCRSADLVLNLSGVNPLRDWLVNVPLRVLIDTDPAFTQVRNLTDPWFRSRTDLHNRFFTFGENIPRPEAGCSVPDDGLAWKPTRQPICLDLWPPAPPPPPTAPWSTIMQWDSYKEREYAGRRFRMKSASFAPYFDLPQQHKTRPFLLALGGGGPREELVRHGWQWVNPLHVSMDPWTYQSFIHQSFGEWSIAKEAYVATRSGWFSERTCCYLASGRPAVVQDTGWSDILPSGQGVLAFSTPDQALEALQRVERDWPLHSAAARRFVHDHFAAEKVLTSLLNQL